MPLTKHHAAPILLSCVALLISQALTNQTTAQTAGTSQKSNVETIRFASFNISFYRSEAGQLKRELSDGKSESPKKIAEIIQRIRPDVILLNEFDYEF